jgi:pilus assembly protein CpaE
MHRSGTQASLAILGPGLPRTDVLAFAEKAEHDRGGVGTLLVAETLEADLLREALRSGVSDVLTVSASAEEWSEAVSRARARIAAEHDLAGLEPDRGRVVCVFSTKGGSGKSLVASNLAVIAAERSRKRVALVDLDLQSGDLAIMFQLMPALSIYDAAQGADRLDEQALEGYFTPHRSGVSLLAAPMEPSLAEQVDADAITAILELLPTMFPLTIIDGPPMFTDQMLAALDRSDEIVLVGSMDVPSIKNLKLAITTMSQLGHPARSSGWCSTGRTARSGFGPARWRSRSGRRSTWRSRPAATSRCR